MCLSCLFVLFCCVCLLSFRGGLLLICYVVFVFCVCSVRVSCLLLVFVFVVRCVVVNVCAPVVGRVLSLCLIPLLLVCVVVCNGLDFWLVD